ncbi:MAG: hypothetical protein ACRC5H_10635 [Treponemataceae bacterium]
MLSIKDLENLSERIESLCSMDVLRQLNKSWQLLLQLQGTCYRFPNADLFLNILVTEKFHENYELLKSLDVSSSFKEIHLIKSLWEKPLNSKTIEEGVRAISQEKIKLSDQVKTTLQHAIVFINQTNHDPIIKQLIFHLVFSKTLPPFDEKNNFLRIVDIFVMHSLGFLDHPLLYPENFMYLFAQASHDYKNQITEENILFFLYNFQQICSVGSAVLLIYNSKCNSAVKLINNDPYLEKLFLSKNLFAEIFQWPVINITTVMNNLTWKRDKTARFLAKLVDLNLLHEIKLGKDKIFVNILMTETFDDIKKNKHIQSIIGS